MDDRPPPTDFDDWLTLGARAQALAERLLDDVHAAEDIAQDTFVAALEFGGAPSAVGASAARPTPVGLADVDRLPVDRHPVDRHPVDRLPVDRLPVDRARHGDRRATETDARSVEDEEGEDRTPSTHLTRGARRAGAPASQPDRAGVQPTADTTGFEGAPSSPAWWTAVARNLARRRSRREGQRRAVEREGARAERVEPTAAQARSSGGDTPHDSSLTRLERLAAALRELDEPHREAVVARYLEGLDSRAIARRLSTSEANARQRVSRGLAKLRARLLAEECGGEQRPRSRSQSGSQRAEANGGGESSRPCSARRPIAGFFVPLLDRLPPAHTLRDPASLVHASHFSSASSSKWLSSKWLTAWRGLGDSALAAKLAVLTMTTKSITIGFAVSALFLSALWFGARTNPKSESPSSSSVVGLENDPALANGPESSNRSALVLDEFERANRTRGTNARPRDPVVDPDPPAAPASFVGTVVDFAGAPIASVRITPLDRDGHPLDVVAPELSSGVAPASGQPAGAVVTSDARGGFALALAPGISSVSFEHPHYLPEVLALPAGASLVRLSRAPYLAGRLRFADGTPPNGPAFVSAMVFDEASGESGEHEARVDANGTFEFGRLPLGRVDRVRARAKGSQEHEQSLALALRPDGEEWLEIELAPGLRVEGQVVDARTNEPIPFARVWADSVDLEEGGVEPNTEADSDGRFVLEGVDGDLREEEGVRFVYLRVAADSPGYVPGPFRPHLVREDEQGRLAVRVVLEPRATDLIVRVLEPDGREPAQGVFVWAWDSTGAPRAEYSNRLGEAEFVGLPAGGVSFHAYRQGIPGERLPAAGRLELDLTPSSTRTHELVLASDASTSLSGTLLGFDGAPLANALVRLQWLILHDGMTISSEGPRTATDARGAWRIDGLCAGTYRVIACECDPNGIVDVDVRLGEETASPELVGGECTPLAGIVDSGGRARGGLGVEARVEESGARILAAEVSAEGHFVFEGLPRRALELVLVDEEGRELDRVSVAPESWGAVELRWP